MMELLQNAWVEFVKVLPLLVVAIVVSQIVEHFLHKRKAFKKIDPSEKNIVRAAGIGLITPGPLLAYLPTLRDLARKGMPPSLLASFITGQTLVGPMRIFLEVGYFGALFFLVRVVISFLLAIFIATSFRFINKKIPLYKKDL